MIEGVLLNVALVIFILLMAYHKGDFFCSLPCCYVSDCELADGFYDEMVFGYMAAAIA